MKDYLLYGNGRREGPYKQSELSTVTKQINRVLTCDSEEEVTELFAELYRSSEKPWRVPSFQTYIKKHIEPAVKKCASFQLKALVFPKLKVGITNIKSENMNKVLIYFHCG